jgi:VacB/RNase II family 3'-5' exoribonuclease
MPSNEAIARLLDCFESNEFAESEGLVVLQSQVCRLRRQTRLLARLRNLVRSNKLRSVVLFDDVHHEETLGLGDMKKVADWYQRHVGHGIEVVLLDDDSSIDAYFVRVWQTSEVMRNLYESLREREREVRERGTGMKMRHADIERGLDQGRLVRGHFEVDARRPRERAWVVVQGERSAIVGRKHRWHAIHGDVVVAEMMDNEVVDDDEVAEDGEDDEDDEVAEDGEDDEDAGHGDGDLGHARIVDVPDQTRRDIIVSIVPEDATEKRSQALCVPFDRVYPKMRLRSSYLTEYVGKRLLVRVIGWDDDARYPNAHVIKVLGDMGDMLTETTCILHRHGIDYCEFSRVTLADLPGASYRLENEVAAAEASPREDFRSRFVVSIDPPGCTDVDDAFHVRVLDDDVFELGIHIADVTHFLQPGTALDEEALFRSTTVYLVDRRLDMLPSRISEDLASLLCGRPRFAVSVVWKVSRTTNEVIGEPWFGRSVIESRYQLEYANAQAILDGSSSLSACGVNSKSDLAETRTALQLVHSLAWTRLRTRLANGAIELDSTELRFDVDAAGLPNSLHEKKTIDSMKIIAELMIMANEAVATQLHRAFPSRALLRCHAAPDCQKLERMRAFCIEVCGDEVERAKLFTEVHRFGADLQQARRIMCAKGSESKAAKALPLLQMTANRCLSEARYVRAASTPSTRHFGLAINLYTHFTSPIRRYADVVVHRQLLASLRSRPASAVTASSGPSWPLQEHVVDRMNERNRASKLAQRECTMLYLLLYLAKSPQTERAIVQDVTDDGSMHVYVPRFDLKGRIDTGDGGATAGVFDSVWVRLEARTSTCHGPTLVVTLVDDRGDIGDIGDVGAVAETMGGGGRDDHVEDLPTPPTSLHIDPIVKLLQDVSLAPQPSPSFSVELEPVNARRKQNHQGGNHLRTAATTLLGKSRIYHQRALRALNQNNQARHDKWRDMAREASHHAARILEYHYNAW